MAANTKLSVAIHTLALLALKEGESLTSQRIAKSVDTNPVVIRRILCALHEAGLVHCCVGKSGGAKLAKSPKNVTLLDVYRAIDDEPLFAQHSENKSCGVSCCLKRELGRVFNDAQGAMAGRLKKTTLAQVLKTIC